TVLLALHLAGVASHEASLLQLGPQLPVHLDESAGDTVQNGAGLTGETAPYHVDLHVQLVYLLHQLQGLAADHLEDLTTKVLVYGAFVDFDGPIAGGEPHAGGGFLATTCTVPTFCFGHVLLFSINARSSGPRIVTPLKGQRLG